MGETVGVAGRGRHGRHSADFWRGAVAGCVALETALVGVGAAVAEAEPIQLQTQVTVLANGVPFDPGGQAIPCVTDWNGDGLPDVLVGYQPAFKVAVYLNSGKAMRPMFTTFSNVQAEGTDIYHWASGCGSPAPWVCDYDSDGKRDLLVGDGQYGRVWFYRNTNTDVNPILASGVMLRNGSGELSVGARATPYVHDWDEDGLPDSLCGDANGNVHFFKNVGTRQSPVYTNDLLIQAGGVALNLNIRSVIRVCDWDGDGIKDLIGSGANNVAWCKNVGNNGSPVLASPARLQAPAAGVGLASIDTGSRMRLDVVDWNNDGVLDLLIGNWDGCLYLYEGYQFALRSITPQPAHNFVLEWNSAEFLAYGVLAGSMPASLHTVLATNLPSAGRITRWTNFCGEARQFYRVNIGP